MELLWFGRPGPRDMVNRHHHPTAPLAVDGRLFIPANQKLFAIDLYNGSLHWAAEIPDSPRLRADLTGNIFVAWKDTLLLATEDKCLRFDMATGKRKSPFELPQLVDGMKYHWGYTATARDILVATAQKPTAAFKKFVGEGVAIATWSPPEHVTADYVVAMRGDTGEMVWSHQNGVIPNSAVAIGDDRIFFVESLSSKAKANTTGKVALNDLVSGEGVRLVAKDLFTGETIWTARPDLGDLQRIIFLSYAEDVVLITGSFVRNSVSMHLLVAHDARRGRHLWTQDKATLFGDVNSGHGELQRHPAIVKGTVYADPWAYNLHTGRKIKGWHFNRGGHGCGPVTASANALFGRAGTHGRYDLDGGGKSTKLSLVSRAGCWVHMLPVGGVLAIPESSSGCTCDFIVQTSMAFKPIARTPRAARKQAVIIDKDAFPLAATHWRVHDAVGANPARSDWRVEGDVVSEHSNIARGDSEDPDPGLERPGTLRVFTLPDGLNYADDAPAARSDSTFSMEFDEGEVVESFSVPMGPAIADLTEGDFTLHTWFKTSDTGRSILMGACCDTLPGALNFELHTGNRLRIWIAGPEATTDLNVSVGEVGSRHDGEWHAATAVRRGKSVELYFDGVRVGKTDDVAGSFSQAAKRYHFGRDARTGETRFSGKLDDVTMWSEALTEEQITALATGASPIAAKLPRPVVHFGFETSAGEAVTDHRSGVGRIDDTAGHPDGPYHGTGEGGAPVDGLDFGDGELSLDLSSDDDDVLGVAFRLRDPEHYYLFAMDRQRGFRALAVKDGDRYRLLDFNEKDYRTFHWYKLDIVLDGPKITIYMDGDKELEAVDETFASGTFGLYAWGCSGAKFRNIVWREGE